MLGISEVVENLYISGLESPTAIFNKGIRAVINISSECPIQDLGPSVDYEKISIPDLPTTSIQPYFDRLADRIDLNLQQGKRTLVHCYVGRSRSASIILAYLMKYRQMSLREAFYYLRSRRSIIGPNFGFIRQLIAYEKSLFGSTTVSFVETSFGSVPDIYLSIGDKTSYSRRQMSTIPVHSMPRTFSSRPTSFFNRSATNLSPIANSRIQSSYRPFSSTFLQDQPEPIRMHSTWNKSLETMHDPYLSTRMNTFRTNKYVPPTFNRYYLP